MSDEDRSIRAFLGDRGERISGTEADALVDLRLAGVSAFTAQGLPHRKRERWKFTDLRRLLMRETYEAARPAPLPARHADRVSALPAPRLVFVNGVLDEAVSDLGQSGADIVRLEALLGGDHAALADRLGETVEADHPMIALNAAWMADGAIVRVPKGVDAGRLHLVSVMTGREPVMAHPRHMILLEVEARLELVETVLGDGAGHFENAVTEIQVSDGARLDHYRHIDAPDGHVALDHLRAHVGRDAVYHGFNLAIGAGVDRTEATVRLLGQGGEARLGGAYLGRGRQHHDNTVLVRHEAPNCLSRQVFKGVLDGRAHGVFQGKIHVDRVAQKTDGYQLNKAILLSPRAEIDAKPELEIYADDVKCSHGATAGQIDTDALFYLRARGIPEHAARGLLIHAFLAEALEEIAAADIRAQYQAAIDAWMAAGGFDEETEA